MFDNAVAESGSDYVVYCGYCMFDNAVAKSGSDDDVVEVELDVVVVTTTGLSLIASKMPAIKLNNMANPNNTHTHQGASEYIITNTIPTTKRTSAINPKINKIRKLSKRPPIIAPIKGVSIAIPRINHTHHGTIEYLITKAIPIIIRIRAAILMISKSNAKPVKVFPCVTVPSVEINALFAISLINKVIIEMRMATPKKIHTHDGTCV